MKKAKIFTKLEYFIQLNSSVIIVTDRKCNVADNLSWLEMAHFMVTPVIFRNIFKTMSWSNLGY